MDPYIVLLFIVYHNSTCAETMSISFCDFKSNEISELIWNKDPLGLNSDMESYKSAKSDKSEVLSKTSDSDKDADLETKMEYNGIPHYLKSAANLNNSTDINKDNTENTSSTLQINNPVINRLTHSVSSGNLARTTSFKSLENIQQSCKRSHANSHEIYMDENLGTSDEILQNNLTIQSKSNECIEDFNIKINEITRQCRVCILAQMTWEISYLKVALLIITLLLLRLWHETMLLQLHMSEWRSTPLPNLVGER